MMTFIILQEKLLIEEDFKEVLQQDEKISQINKRITETKKNLDNLRRSVYMGLIPDKAFFLAEQESPEKEVARLEDERSKVVAIANDWKDVANDAFMFARYAKEDFDSDDWERKRAVIKRLGANLKLSGRTIEFTPVKYLVPVAEESECLKAKKEAARTASQQMKKRPQRGLNFILVRETGLEPARPKAYAPKAYVYTNFTTRAKTVKVTTTILTKSHPNINSAWNADKT